MSRSSSGIENPNSSKCYDPTTTRRHSRSYEEWTGTDTALHVIIQADFFFLENLMVLRKTWVGGNAMIFEEIKNWKEIDTIRIEKHLTDLRKEVYQIGYEHVHFTDCHIGDAVDELDMKISGAIQLAEAINSTIPCVPSLSYNVFGDLPADFVTDWSKSNLPKLVEDLEMGFIQECEMMCSLLYSEYKKLLKIVEDDLIDSADFEKESIISITDS
jgi:hypothetical protein